MQARRTALQLCVLACLPMVVIGAAGCASSDSKASLYAGNANYRSAQYGKAVAEYSKAIREAAGRGRFGRDLLVQAYVNRGTAFERMGKLDRAVVDYDKAISVAFSNPAPYNGQSQCSSGTDGLPTEYAPSLGPLAVDAAVMPRPPDSRHRPETGSLPAPQTSSRCACASCSPGCAGPLCRSL